MRNGWTEEGNTFVLRHNNNLAVVVDAKDGTHLWKLILTIGDNKVVIRFPSAERAMIYAENKLQYSSLVTGVGLWAMRFLFLFTVFILVIWIFTRM